MREPKIPATAPYKTEDARDLQARLYREIGISAVAAALRFTSQPDPTGRSVEPASLPPEPQRKTLAA